MPKFEMSTPCGPVLAMPLSLAPFGSAYIVTFISCRYGSYTLAGAHSSSNVQGLLILTFWWHTGSIRSGDIVP